jgi:hypothetical protein
MVDNTHTKLRSHAMVNKPPVYTKTSKWENRKRKGWKTHYGIERGHVYLSIAS